MTEVHCSDNQAVYYLGPQMTNKAVERVAVLSAAERCSSFPHFFTPGSTPESGGFGNMSSAFMPQKCDQWERLGWSNLHSWSTKTSFVQERERATRNSGWDWRAVSNFAMHEVDANLRLICHLTVFAFRWRETKCLLRNFENNPWCSCYCSGFIGWGLMSMFSFYLIRRALLPVPRTNIQGWTKTYAALVETKLSDIGEKACVRSGILTYEAKRKHQ